MSKSNFEWDDDKNIENQQKHGVSFDEAQHAFFDKNRIIVEDLSHSQNEERFYCLGLNENSDGVLTVRFTYRSGKIRIFGAGYWRKGNKVYEQNNSI